MPGNELLAWVQTQWALQPPLRLRSPQVNGRSHRTHVLETGNGRFILRRYHSSRSPAHIDYEQQLVQQLQTTLLPFAVPAPLPTRNDQTLAHWQQQPIALFPFVLGQPRRPVTVATAQAIGTALGQVTQALTAFAPPTFPTPPSSDLAEALVLLPTLPLASDKRQQLQSGYEQLRLFAPAATAALPQQLIHGDTIYSNVLLQGKTVTAVLDFEFSHVDVRLIDVATALMSWSGPLRGQPQAWPLLAALLNGYTSQVALTPAERHHLPDIMALRYGFMLLQFMRRYAAGKRTETAVRADASYVLGWFTWLQKNQTRLRQLG